MHPPAPILTLFPPNDTPFSFRCGADRWSTVVPRVVELNKTSQPDEVVVPLDSLRSAGANAQKPSYPHSWRKEEAQI